MLRPSFALLFSLACLVGCDVLPSEKMPTVATMQLEGVEAHTVNVVFATGSAARSPSESVILRGDTLRFRLPVKREFAVEGGSFAFTIERSSPGRDGLSARIWADDFLFVNLESVPDTQRVVRVYYRHDAKR